MHEWHSMFGPMSINQVGFWFLGVVRLLSSTTPLLPTYILSSHPPRWLHSTAFKHKQSCLLCTRATIFRSMSRIKPRVILIIILLHLPRMSTQSTRLPSSKTVVLLTLHQNHQSSGWHPQARATHKRSHILPSVWSHGQTLRLPERRACGSEPRKF